ncbi:hypothetical protein AB0873_15065 [Micromonospora sp. NPDC047707]|uniref:hypothetical protein n=1 Tax=Micromonospora sp. NPDC047707 TaxID=3154498 RepID=UPI00345633A3
MVHVPSLPVAERLVLAELLGIAGRYGTGMDRDAPRGDALAAVCAVSTDPWLLGIAAGTVAASPHGLGGPTIALLAAAGADMSVATEHAADTQARLEAMGIRYDHPPAA